MKSKVVFSFLLLTYALSGRAQSASNYNRIKPYIAIIKTNDSKVKGLFFKIDSQNVLLYSKGKYLQLKTADVKSIKLRVTKPGYELQSYIFQYIGKEDPQQYKYINQRGKAVDKWGREEPTPNEELGNAFAQAIFGTAMEGIANVIAGSLHQINPSVADYKFRKGFNFDQLEPISYYSVYYQQNPNTLAELKRIKSLSSNFKP